MNQRVRLMIGLMLVATMAACSPSQPPAEPEAAQPAEEMSASPPVAEPSVAEPPAPTPIVPASGATSGSMVVYACEDGSGVTVTYDKYGALVKLPTGSTMLSRAESASNGGSDAYLGEELSLYRSGNLVQLQVAGKSRNCTESPTGG
ncbi:MAG: hypothetical protein ACREEK_20955 [Bradyrhizobium sp.]